MADAVPPTAAAPEHPWLVRFLMALTGPWNRESVLSLVKLVVLILFIKGCIIDQYSIPSGSMEPTLHGDERFLRGDRVLVNKWLYGPRIPFTTIRLWDWAEPKRWDIVVFKPVKGASNHPILIKRVVGLPGERVRIAGGGIEVNGERLEFPASLPPGQYYCNDLDILQRALTAPTPQERRYWEAVREQYPLRYGVREEDQYLVVPKDHYLMLGDNSLESVDSRVFGWVPRHHVYGRAFGMWWPWPRRQDFTGFSHTWWGKLLLYGIPALLLAAEVRQYLRQRRRQTPAG
ncbi:MAG: signal peptidase I [Candidatus Hydrogenedentes bacterium]|nr:signal peptidase I [Candidatus Hydrogenedentota bacterium]